MSKRFLSRLAVLSFVLSTSYASGETAIVVSSQSEIKSYDEQALSNLYLAKAKTMPNAGRTIPLDLNDTNPAKQAFHEAVTKKSLGQLRSYWSRMVFTGEASPPDIMASDQEMAEFVSRNPDTVGYVDISVVNEKLRVLRTLP